MKFFKNKNTNIVWQVADPEEVTRLMQNAEFEEVSEDIAKQNNEIIGQAEHDKYAEATASMEDAVAPASAANETALVTEEAHEEGLNAAQNQNFTEEFGEELAAIPESEVSKRTNSNRKAKTSAKSMSDI